jgi:hypothetical protein
MEFPEELQRIINAYAKPITKGDWRKGSYTAKCNNHIKYMGNQYLVNILLKDMINGMGHQWNEKLIPSGKDFNEEHYLCLYDAVMSDMALWEDEPHI